MLAAKITEIFKSYQGEGLWQFKRQVFIRFSGCNLNCRFCDTKTNAYRSMSVKDVLAEVDQLDCFHSVSLTGGEPLAQIEFLAELCRKLKASGRITYLETNGTLPDSLKKVINSIDMVAVDFKLPSTTGCRPFWEEHRDFIKIALETKVFLKAVIGEKTILSDLRKAIKIIKSVSPELFLVLQPENPYENKITLKLENFRKECQANSIAAAIISQAHKRLGIK